MKIQWIFDFLDILYDFPTILEVRQHTGCPALIKQRAFIVVKSDCWVNESSNQSHKNEADIFLG